MATAIRIQESLVTIRCSLIMEYDGARVIVELFRGGQKVGDAVRMRLEELGIDPTPDTSNALPEGPKKPERLWDIFHKAGSMDDGPIWLQLAYGADILAAYPWETEWSDAAEKTILRIPNFLKNTYHPDHTRPIAICVSAPRAKGSPPWKDALHGLLGILASAPGRRIVLFLGPYELDDMDPTVDTLRGRYPDLQIDLAPAPKALISAARVRGIVQSPDVQNPWAVWIAETLEKTGAQALHFISPGYAIGNHGALAMPESPLRNQDRNWSRFVGATELAALLDRISSPILGITGIGSLRWVTGLRLLANEVSWIRPGPVVFTRHGGPDSVNLGQAYRCLLDGYPIKDLPMHDGSFSVHPAALYEAGGSVLPDIPTRGINLQVREALLPEKVSPLLDHDLAPRLQRELTRLSSVRPRSEAGQAYDAGAIRALDFVANAIAGKKAK